jgi:adenosine deaminase
MHRRSTIAWLLVAACTVAAAASGQQRPARPPSAEASTVRRFAAIRDEPVPLFAFLRRMPKGGDLHNHLSGAVPTEALIDFAINDGLCIDATFTPSFSS